jgi:hypothetical protein
VRVERNSYIERRVQVSLVSQISSWVLPFGHVPISVSEEASTMLVIRSFRQASRTLYVLMVLVLNWRLLFVWPGEGMAAR